MNDLNIHVGSHTRDFPFINIKLDETDGASLFVLVFIIATGLPVAHVHSRRASWSFAVEVV